MAKWNNIKIRKYILYKPQLKKEKIMSKKAREQLIALLTLSSVFIFFIYLKMNPEISATLLSSEPQIDKIIEEQIEFVEKKQLSEIEKEKIISPLNDENDSIILYTQNELKRAKSYLDRNWRPDDTINIAAWEYVSKNPNIKNLVNPNNNESEVVNIIE